MQNYKNPPVDEVVAEFYFNQSDWDLVVPGLLYEQLKKNFPTRRTPNPAPISLPAPPQYKSIGAEIFIPNPFQRNDRVWFFSSDETKLVQVAPNLLVVNNVKAYSGWNSFLPTIKQAFEAYEKVLPNARVSRVGLQYINKFEFALDPSIKFLENFLEFRPFRGAGLPQDVGPFSIASQLSSGLNIIVIHLGGANPTNATQSVVLDIRCSNSAECSFGSAEVYNWMEDAHREISKIFEACITDKSREIFNK